VLFSDDSEEGLEIFEKDASNGLSYEKMCSARHQQHPRVLRYDMKSDTSTYALHPLCGTKTGWSHCRRSRRQSDLNDYGVGLVLYFQFQKYLVVMMFLFTVLSIPTCLLFYHGSVTFVAVEEDGGVIEHIHVAEATEVTPFSSAHLNTLLAKFTLGNLGEVHDHCGVLRHSESSSTSSRNVP
jgi:hypothetical protein